MKASSIALFIQIESAAEQQENIKNQRKTLKVLQGVATDKENLTGRPQIDKLSRLKAATETTLSASTDYAKRKKIETRAAETQTSPDKSEAGTSQKKITAEDLTGEAKPGEHYWERLAEKRREALEQSLEENQRLYERIEGLEEELNTSRKQLEEAQHLVAVLTEMLDENEEEQGIENEDKAADVEEEKDSNDDNSDDESSDDSTPTKAE
ncbi:geminin DNA replication inhibitor [Haematobia irritans]|uniref:geminin DNA replication inhibitor n=1 Tax=Haematobia irritans TaxID=7368 RepID=UPI003F4FD28C